MVRQGHMGTHAVSRQWIFSICVTGQDVMQVTRQSALCVYTVQCTLYIYILIFMSVCTFDGEVGCGNSQYHVLNGLWGWEIFPPPPRRCCSFDLCDVSTHLPAINILLRCLSAANLVVIPVAGVLVRCLLCVSSSQFAVLQQTSPCSRPDWNWLATPLRMQRGSSGGANFIWEQTWRSLRKTTGRATTTGLLMKL